MRSVYIVIHRAMNDEELASLIVAESDEQARRFAKVPDFEIIEVNRVPMDKCGRLAVYYV